MNRRILFVGGHTGGHLFPAEALAHSILEMGEGTPVLLDHGREQEKNVFQKAGMEKVLAPWRGKGRFSSATRVFAARKLLREEKIDAVICMGAFPCIAPGLAAATLRKPLFLLEQNRVMGKANRILALFASKIFLSMPLLKSSRSIRARSAILGCPVRDEFQPTGLPEEPLRLVVMGGSQGAREVNQKVLEIFSHGVAPHGTSLDILHQIGPREALEPIVDSWAKLGIPARVVPFIQNPARAMRDAHFVMGRAGGSTLAELNSVGRPSLLFPLRSHSDQHQLHNARYLEDHGCALVFDGQNSAFLADQLRHLLGRPDRLCSMVKSAQALGSPHASKRIAEMIGVLLRCRESGRMSVPQVSGEKNIHPAHGKVKEA
ncbi:UDP-N-acetylglucosamine--N-acetylmuramyl-(pentapeptide) pyrophosphoryl-undecaprenol N-acetylglucosamine transferase [Planctomycetota bacterium]|nr:UDP-N-acetylglucosamine--N-acetylmuramyl-(pentapeptide) pyrophosphoryl-undecaprenol N-acetylglucosamine transferase [Planctomycetota bacterium]